MPTIQINKLPKSQVELTIELGQEELKPFLIRAVETLSREMKIPGFRPGYAPYDIVKSEAGEMKIYQEALEPAIAKTYSEAVIAKKLITIGKPRIEVVKLAPGNPLVYKATVPLLPEINIGTYKRVKIGKKNVKVEEKEVDDTLKELQRTFAKEKRVQRKAQSGDKVEIDLQTFLDNVSIDAGQSKNHPVTIGDGRFVPGFEDNLVGLAEQEEKRFELKFPKNYYRKELAGKLIAFSVRMKAVFEIEMQPLDDAFARQVGRFETLQNLRQQLHENILEEKKLKEKERWQLALIDAILKKSSFGEIPDLLMESELHKMMHELEQDAEKQGMKFHDYLASIKKNQDELQRDFRPRADKRIKTALILREIAKREIINVTDAELEDEHKKQIQQYSTNHDVLKHIQTEEYKDYLKNVMIGNKVFELLEKDNE